LGGLWLAEQPQGPLLLEVKRAGWLRLYPADAPPQLGDIGPDARVGEYAYAESQRYRADVVTALDRHAERDGSQVRLAELAVRSWPGRPRGPSPARPPSAPVPQRRQQAERLPVTEHPGRQAESLGGLGDPHARILQVIVRKRHLSVPAAADLSYGQVVAPDRGLTSQPRMTLARMRLRSLHVC
jgi:hypothetical protein